MRGLSGASPTEKRTVAPPCPGTDLGHGSVAQTYLDLRPPLVLLRFCPGPVRKSAAVVTAQMDRSRTRSLFSLIGQVDYTGGDQAFATSGNAETSLLPSLVAADHVGEDLAFTATPMRGRSPLMARGPMSESKTHSDHRYDARHAVDRSTDSRAQKEPGDNA